ncbi:hypothetical protein LCGC14_2834820 [marine sediment metagenome]|uniref:Translation initiation factor IF2/IF5 domain-containing protein n=2 Tax=root TaxID=1 RepID=A0A0F9ALD5_9ZZZZ|nr:MAG: translation initiation factor 2, beta subunit [Marseillevirus LCMAC202]
MSFTNSKQLNIGGSASDPFYRYKMPKISTVVQRKSGGTTVVDNTQAICDSLSRDASVIAKFLSKELGRPVQLKNGSWSMHGEVKMQTIQECIFSYIKAYVLCGVCGNPETILHSKKLECKSCGNETKLHS